MCTCVCVCRDVSLCMCGCVLIRVSLCTCVSVCPCTYMCVSLCRGCPCVFVWGCVGMSVYGVSYYHCSEGRGQSNL